MRKQKQALIKSCGWKQPISSKSPLSPLLVSSKRAFGKRQKTEKCQQINLLFYLLQIFIVIYNICIVFYQTDCDKLWCNAWAQYQLSMRSRQQNPLLNKNNHPKTDLNESADYPHFCATWAAAQAEDCEQSGGCTKTYTASCLVAALLPCWICKRSFSFPKKNKNKKPPDNVYQFHGTRSESLTCL